MKKLMKLMRIHSLPNIYLGMSIQIIRLFFPSYQRFFVVIRVPYLTQTWHAPQGAGLDVSSEPDDIHHNREGDSQEAEPDNVVRVEVAGGQLLVAVVHPVVDVLVLPVALHRPEAKGSFDFKRS